MAISDEFRAGRLAGLAQLDLALPATVRAAITGYEAIMALPVPAPPYPGADRRAITDTADRLARDAMLGKRPAAPPQPLDVTAITAARQADMDGHDRAALARELRTAAAAVLCQVFSGDNGQQVIGAIQARHADVVDGLCRHARLLPEATTDADALEQGGATREHFLACRDAVAELSRLREAIRLADHGTPPDPVDGIAITTGWERSGALAGTWLAPVGTTTHGDIGTLEFWLSAARVDGYRFWLPTAAEQAARIAELHADRQRQRLAAAR
jgi:hypothetical protein